MKINPAIAFQAYENQIDDLKRERDAYQRHNAALVKKLEEARALLKDVHAVAKFPEENDFLSDVSELGDDAKKLLSRPIPTLQLPKV